MKTEDKILIVATRARKTIEKLNARLNYLFPTTLEGLCGVASGHLFTLLRKAKLKPVIRSNDYHYFVECGGFIVDITATQFYRKKILVIPDNKKRYAYHTNKSLKHKSLRDFINWQKKQGWRREAQYIFYKRLF